LLLFSLLLFSIFLTKASSSEKVECIKEIVKFKTADSIELTGILYLPKGNIKSVVLYLTHPTLSSININRSDSLDYDFNLIQRLLQKKIGWFVFSTRSSSFMSDSKNLVAITLSSTMKTYADDAEAAIACLKSKKNLKGVSFGIMGGSNAGCTSAIVASRSKKISYAIIISSLFTTGIQWHKYAIVHSEQLPGSNELLRKGFYSLLKDSFTYNKQRFKKNDSIVSWCIFNSLDSANKKIVKYNNYDTIVKKAGEVFKSLWNMNDFTPKKNKYTLAYTPLGYMDSIFAYLYYKPIDIEMIKWDPEIYYPKINIPVLILFGDKDIVIEVQPNIIKSRELAKKYKKNNFKIVVIKNCGHSLDEPTNEINPLDRSNIIKPKMSVEAINIIPKWVDEHTL
jgi:pimeloyl-ACP methyl ester carboxylesterase